MTVKHDDFNEAYASHHMRVSESLCFYSRNVFCWVWLVFYLVFVGCQTVFYLGCAGHQNTFFVPAVSDTEMFFIPVLSSGVFCGPLWVPAVVPQHPLPFGR